MKMPGTFGAAAASTPMISEAYRTGFESTSVGDRYGLAPVCDRHGRDSDSSRRCMWSGHAADLPVLAVRLRRNLRLARARLPDCTCRSASLGKDASRSNASPEERAQRGGSARALNYTARRPHITTEPASPSRSLFAIMQTGGDDRSMVRIEGTIRFNDGPALWSSMLASVSGVQKGSRLDFDVSRVDEIDGGSMALLVQMRADLSRRGATCDFVGASGQVQKLIALYRGDVRVGKLLKPRRVGFLDQVGTATLDVVHETKLVFGFFGQALRATAGVIAKPSTGNWGDVAPTMERSGADAVPIVVMINFLIGVVMAFQGAVQLKQFGANIYVADLVSLSICRELGPLMTAIILCGRSGAAFAAEIGSMKVSEEIDALRTMGFGPMRYLVLPRLIAMTLVLPLLALLGDAFGILGGLFVGITTLDLTVVGYFTETRSALTLWDIFSGMLKSGAFAAVIALIACQQGLATTGGAAGVGRRTTSAVVSILFALILVDACFTIFFAAVGK